MRVTKHEHAALLVEDAGKALIVDPGSFTNPFTELHNVIGIVITHEHADHWTPEHLERILKQTGPIPILGPAGVVTAAADFDVTEVSPGDTVTIDPFTLRFFGGRHAVIHESIPVVDNVGVLFNDVFYYPGDSYAVPEGVDVKLLAAPVGAPWLKIGEAMDFVLAVKPRRVFGTHDMTLSVAGRDMGRARLGWAAEQDGGELVALDPGDSADV
ncbi:MBL fold metallo-hydrolase [Microbacterium rhizosphaerae]|uniref:MBL fold metallo-hydrolase n=1 Tax=Microbacterium rhizosphaerae TaxID=1678237 RepID=A0ABZ0SGM1_9MICO|nr:MBL fold metallo-hydrolase [Microbacterium rhizosphaerae]WPR88259.1 MBL fold metallo-hydrolase [Microbacterium rhizosphaerae]